MSAIAKTAERFSFRLGPEKKLMIERAAAVRGLSLTEFAILTLSHEAREVPRSEQVLVLSDRDRDAFLAALDIPPAPNAKALEIAKRYKTAKVTGKLR